MKKLTLAEWEKQYITGPVKQFDQKYTMGRRDAWDETIWERRKNLPAIPEVSDEPGWRLSDWAMRVGPRSLTYRLELLNLTKPNEDYEEIMKAYGITSPRLNPPKGAKLDLDDPAKLTMFVKKAAVHFGANLVGIAPLDRRWIYSNSYNTETKQHKALHIPEEYKFVIVKAYGSGYDMRKYFPTYINTWSSVGQRQMLGSAFLASVIQGLGFKTIDSSFDDIGLAIPHAMQAGLGQLGRMGMLITPQFGANVRLGQIITDMPLIPDQPIDFGVTEFCNACKKCAETCPSHSITRAPRSTEPITISSVANELKWQFNAETCHINGYKKPCQICISVCPFTKPNTAFHRTVRWFVDNVRWADPFYVKMDNLLGYGKPHKADNFLNEWHPRPYDF
jgi:reductive dehalogenase